MHIGYMIASALVHGAIYGMIYKLLRHMGLGGSFLLCSIIVGLVFAFMRSRGPRWNRY